MTRGCEVCGKPFEAKRATAKYCGGTCRVRATRSRAAGESGAVKPAVVLPSPDLDGDVQPLVSATRSELEAAGRLDTMLGQQALRLAERMCSQHDTGSATAAVSRELRAVMDAALAGAPKAADSLDELADRRRLKASGA